MRRTPTLQAAAASLGLMAGFAMTPADRSPLERSLTPHAVAVAWSSGGGGPERPVAGVEVDDRGGRLVPTPPPAGQRTKLPAVRARAPQGRPAAPKPAPRPDPRRFEPVRRELVVRESDRAVVTFGVPEKDCPRHARGT